MKITAPCLCSLWPRAGEGGGRDAPVTHGRPARGHGPTRGRWSVGGGGGGSRGGQRSVDLPLDLLPGWVRGLVAGGSPPRATRPGGGCKARGTRGPAREHKEQTGRTDLKSACLSCTAGARWLTGHRTGAGTPRPGPRRVEAPSADRPHRRERLRARSPPWSARPLPRRVFCGASGGWRAPPL